MRPTRIQGLMLERVEAEVLVYRSDSEDAAALNEAAAAVFDLCDGSRDVDRIVEELRGGDPALGRDEVLLALNELRDAGLIDGAHGITGPSRRQLLGRLGAATIAAAAIPVVEVIVGPSIAAASAPRQAASSQIFSSPAEVTITVLGAIVSQPTFTG
jgi:Coenzyme PQQ synthesis protein D (PqqD)